MVASKGILFLGLFIIQSKEKVGIGVKCEPNPCTRFQEGLV